VLEERGNRLSLYATELTEDISKVWVTVLGQDSPAYRSLMRKQLIMYWHPWLVLKYKCEVTDPQEGTLLIERCTQWFRKILLFWLITYPVLVLPSSFIRRARSFVLSPGKSDAHPIKLQRLIYDLMNKLGVQNRTTRRFEAASAVAKRHKELLRVGKMEVS
jgi:hypothetical protein